MQCKGGGGVGLVVWGFGVRDWNSGNLPYLVAKIYGLNFIKIRGIWIFRGQKPPIRGLTIIKRSWNSGNQPYLVANTYGLNFIKMGGIWIFRGQKPSISGGYMWCIFWNSYKRWCLLMCVKFCDNWLRNEVSRAVTPFQRGRSPLLGGYMWPVMTMFEIVQEIMFVNVWVKFRDNWLRNEVCRAVTLFEHVRMYVRADPYIPCKGIIIIIIVMIKICSVRRHNSFSIC